MAVITFSRQYGSGGDEMAARVREVLGYRLFDKRLMVRVASELGLSDNEIVDFSEENYRVRSFLERLFGRRSPRVVAETSSWTRSTNGVRSVEVEQLDEEWCVRMVKATIEAAYAQGDIVIVGRGGQAILRDKPDVLHVRVTAPLADRLDRIKHRTETSESSPPFDRRQAEQMLVERDRAAAAYLKRFYDVDWDDPLLYHLVINTAMCDTEAAAGLVVEAVNQLLPVSLPA